MAKKKAADAPDRHRWWWVTPTGWASLARLLAGVTLPATDEVCWRFAAIRVGPGDVLELGRLTGLALCQGCETWLTCGEVCPCGRNPT
jgi:hypothetical protein